MPSDYKATLDFQVSPDGPKVKLTDNGKVDGYDRIDVELKKDDSKRIDLQPTTDEEYIRFLIIKRSDPDPKAETKPDPQKLNYKVNGAEPPIPLENQHVIMGSGVFKFFKDAPTWLQFESKQDEAVTVTIIVGRNMPKSSAGTGTGASGKMSSQTAP